MDSPELYARYDRDEVLSLFRAKSRDRRFCDGQWVILKDTALCFATLGAQRLRSHFTDAGHFQWVAEKEFRVGKADRFLPDEVTAGHRKRRTIHLFAQPTSSDQFVYCGQLAPSAVQEFGSPENFGEAWFKLSPALPSAIWTTLGGYEPGDMRHTDVDSSLARLAGANSEDRFLILKRLVEYWHGPISTADGYTVEELRAVQIPEALRRWFLWAGRRTAIMSGHNQLLDPQDLVLSDGMMPFYIENQGCYAWATCPGDDPPVFGRTDDREPWVPEGICVSEHLILVCLFQAICHSPYGAAASWLDEDELATISRHVNPLAIGTWKWPTETRFYAHGGAFMCSMPNHVCDGKQGYLVQLGAKSEHPLAFLKPMLDDGWEYVAV